MHNEGVPRGTDATLQHRPLRHLSRMSARGCRLDALVCLCSEFSQASAISHKKPRWDFALRRTQGIVCISDYVNALVTKYGIPAWVVSDALQKMFFDFPRDNGSTSEKPLMINVGVISERKRQHQLLQTLESLRSEGLDFDVMFVGRLDRKSPYGRTFDEMLASVRAKHVGFEHVEFLDDTSFCRLFDRASAMIHFSSEESFGLTFAESIARGLYLFASDVGAVRDIITGVKRAQVFGVDDWEGMKRAVREWIVSNQWRQPRPEKPPSEFIQKYHPVSVAQRHIEIYQEILRR